MGDGGRRRVGVTVSVMLLVTSERLAISVYEIRNLCY
jgi:hypothetical protein